MIKALSFLTLIFAIPALSAETLQIQQEVPWYSGEISEEESSDQSGIPRYYLDLAMSIFVVSGATGASVGGFMIGAGCMQRPENINHGLCIAGIAITSISSGWLIAGTLVTGGLCIYKYYKQE